MRQHRNSAHTGQSMMDQSPSDAGIKGPSCISEPVVSDTGNDREQLYYQNTPTHPVYMDAEPQRCAYSHKMLLPVQNDAHDCGSIYGDDPYKEIPAAMLQFLCSYPFHNAFAWDFLLGVAGGTLSQRTKYNLGEFKTGMQMRKAHLSKISYVIQRKRNSPTLELLGQFLSIARCLAVKPDKGLKFSVG